MNEAQPLPEQGGEPSPRQIQGLPSTEQAASVEGASIHKAWAEMEFLSSNATPEKLERDAAFQEHGRNQRFRQHFERIAIIALYVAAFAITVVGAIWLWHMSSAPRLRWLSGEDVSHLQSIMTAGLLVGVIGNHFKKRMG